MKKILLVLLLLSAVCVAQNVGDVSAMDTTTVIHSPPQLAPPDAPTIPIEQLPTPWQGPAALIGFAIMIVGRIVYGMHTGKNFWEALGSAIFKGNNQKVPIWIILFLSALLLSCNPSAGIWKITRDKDKTCVDGGASFNSPVPLNQDSLLQEFTKKIVKYAYVTHLQDSGQTRKYGWGFCLPDSLFQKNPFAPPK